MGINKSLPEDSFTLNDNDIRYGIIRISKHKEWFPANSDITIICKNKNGDWEKYRKRIPSGGNYISGLTKQHSNNNAVPGTIVSITKTAEGYHLEYKHNNTSDDGLSGLIESLRLVIKDYTWAFYKNETNVRTEIIDPILSKLDWKFPEKFYRELVCYSGGNVDYALHDGNNFCIVIEAKSIDEDVEKAKQQIINYINDQRFNECIGIVTNGIIWKVIDNDEQNNELATADLREEGFIDFIKIFHNSNFNIETVRKNLSTLSKRKSQETIEKDDFDIIDDGIITPGKDATDKFFHFIEKHKDKVLVLENKKCFNVKVISSELKDFRDSTRKQCKEHPVTLDRKKYYITRDHTTLRKRMIVQQIIYLLKLNASIEVPS